MITPDQLKKIAPYASAKSLAIYAPMLNTTMDNYFINTPLRICHFLAQVIHESGSFLYTVELASGSAYEYRADLGNTQKGDGPRFKGRGFIQLTGRANYDKYGKAIGVDLISNPDLVATTYPADVSGWFWDDHDINALADADNIKAVTRMINGGYNGLDDRESCLKLAKSVLIPA